MTIILHPLKQFMNISDALYAHQHLVLLEFF